MGSLNLALQKQWNSWTGKLSVNDVLFTSYWRTENQFGNLNINGSGGSDSRNVSLYLSYSFGQNDVKEKRRRDSAAEEEKNRL
jgi:hypothetical protein